MDRRASVVIPSWNGASLLTPTLEHLTKLEGLSFEVLVIDHGRLNLDSEKVVSDFSAHDPRIKYVGLDEQLGYAGAVNYGAALAENPLVAVLCNDVLVQSDWLLELVLAFERRKELGKTAVVSSLVTRPGFDAPLEARINFWGRIVHTGEEPESYVPFFPDGSAFLFDKSFLGLPFDAEYFLYQEDVSLGWRSWLSGGEVVLAPKSRALNADGGTTRRTPYKTAFFTERNRWLNLFEYLSSSVLLKSLPLFFFDALLKLCVGSNRVAKIHAWAWLARHPRKIIHKRKVVQAQRKRSDSEILPLISAKYSTGGGFPVRLLNSLCLAYVRLFRIPLA